MTTFEDVPLKVALWRVLVEPIVPKETSEGGIILAAQTISESEITTAIGKVVQLGSMAYKSKTRSGLNLDEEPNKAKVGDYVLFNAISGHKIRLKNGRKLKLLNDDSILAIITDPDQVKGLLD